MGHDNRTTEAVPTLSMRQAGSRSYVQKRTRLAERPFESF